MSRIGLVERPARGAVRTESLALYNALGAFMLASAAGLILFSDRQVPLSGSGSLGGGAAIAGVLTGAVSFVSAYLTSQHRPSPAWHTRLSGLKRVFDVSALAFIHVAIFALLCLATFFILSDAFRGLVLDGPLAAVILGGTAALASYSLYLTASRVTAYTLSNALAIFLVSGTLTSMITSDDPSWWLKNFSELGASGGFSAYAFNVTLIVSGIVIAALADYTTADLRALSTSKPNYQGARISVLTGVLVLLGALLTLVGALPLDQFFVLHTIAASGMVGIFVALMLGLRWVVPHFSRTFFWLSYLFVGIIVFAGLLFFPIGYYNLTAFELLSAALVFSWLVIFIRNVAADLEDR